MGIYTDAVQKLYVAYFNRPADAAGLTYWEGVVAAQKGSTAAVSAAFAASAEYKAAYAGMDAYSVVATVYQNLFGHAPDLPGLTFWGQGLLNKTFTVDTAVTEIAKGAQGTDLAAYNNKVAAATAFTLALDTPAEVLGYNGDAANLVAKNWLSTIGSDAAGLAAAIATAALNATVQAVVDAHDGTTGTSFTLTAGMDTIVGTNGNDTINAYAFNPANGADATNMLSYDSIDGGAGKDTLNISIAATRNAQFGTIKNVEIINISADVATAIDASVFQGATQVNQLGTAGAVTNLAAGTTAGFQGTTINGALSVAAAGASAAVAFTNVSETATLAVTGSKLAAVTVSGTRVDAGTNGVDALALSVTAGKDVQSVSITSNQKTVLTLAEGAGTTKHIATIDASASTADFTYNETTAGNVAVANISTGSGKDIVTVTAATSAATATAAAVNSVIATGAGNDTIVVANTGTGLTTVDGGAGDDGITVTKLVGAGLSIGGADGNDTITLQGAALETTDVIDGGVGTDVIALGGATTARVADDYIVFNKLLKNFETIKFTSLETGLDASKLAANYTTLDLFAGSAITGVGTQAVVANGNVGVTAAGYVAGPDGAYAGNINLTEKASGTVTANADVLTLAVKAASAANTAVTLAGDVQSASITLTNTVNSSSNPTADRLAIVTIDTAAADSALKSLTLSGTGSATVTNAAGTALTSVDASALGGTLTVAGTATAGLTYVSANTKAETIKLGSGIDKITLNASTYGKMDTISGLSLVAKADGSALTAGSDQLNVGAAGTFVKFTTAQTDLDLALKDAAASNKTSVVFTMGGDTYIFQDKGTIGSVDSADVVVKLVGTVNLDTLILALGNPVV